MKKLLLISLSALTLAACSEQDAYHQAVLEQISNDPDIKSYHLDPITVTECIVDVSSKKMPGIAPFEPRRKTAYLGYTKMISLKTAEKPADVLKELQGYFGSPQGLADAHMNYSESYLECLSTVTNRELDEQEDNTQVQEADQS